MNKTMYELNYHSDAEGEFTRYSVTPITVVRQDILPGCSMESITAIDHTGRRFLGSIENYYASEEAAWDAARRDLQGSIEVSERRIAELVVSVDKLKKALEDLK